MNIEKWIIAHFSPTGGTKKVADAIPLDNPSETRNDLCINCMRCVEACPTNSRALPDAFLTMITQMLNQNAAGYKKPVIFL